MTNDRSLERAARSWIEEGPTRAPDRPVLAALDVIQTTNQERDLRVPWRLTSMNPVTRLALVAVMAILVAGVAVISLRPTSNVAAPPTPISTASPTPTSTPVAAAQPTNIVLVPETPLPDPPGAPLPGDLIVGKYSVNPPEIIDSRESVLTPPCGR